MEAELDRAEIVDPKNIPANVITMRTTVRLKDLVSGDENTYSLVFPTEADFSQGKISVLAPIGTPFSVTGAATRSSGPYLQVCEDSRLIGSFISRRRLGTLIFKTQL